MKNFYQKGGSGGGRGRFDHRRDDRERPQMYQATCAECGNDCEVPFRPSGNKPVYCNNCFSKTEAGQERANARSHDGPRNMDRKMYSATCDQCGDRCEVPFRPSGDRPILCSNCFGRDDRRDSRRPDSRGSKTADYKNDFAQLNTKLDEVIKLLGDIIKPKKIVKRMKPEKKVEAEETVEASPEE